MGRLTILCLCATVLLIPIIHSLNVRSDNKEEIEQEIEVLARALEQELDTRSEDGDDSGIFEACLDMCEDDDEPMACLYMCMGGGPAKKSVQQRGWWRAPRIPTPRIPTPRLPSSRWWTSRRINIPVPGKK